MKFVHRHMNCCMKKVNRKSVRKIKFFFCSFALLNSKRKICFLKYVPFSAKMIFKKFCWLVL